MEEDQAVVIDCGTRNTKVGFAGEEKPKFIFPTIFGHIKNNHDQNGFPKGDTYIGDQVRRNSGEYIIKYPIEHGKFANFEDMEKLFDFIFKDELRYEPKNHSVLIIEPPQNPRFIREKQIEIMFEKYNVSHFCVRSSSLLVLYASGRNSGIVLDIGEGVSYVDPFYDGFSNIHGAKRQNFGGSDLNEYLEYLLQIEQGIAFNTSSDREIVRDIKEKQCYVALDYESELKICKETTECNSSYFYNDGNELKLSLERFKCPEILFNPFLFGYEFKGIHNFVFDSIMKCPINTRADLYVNIILSGGSTMIPGLPERLDKEMKKLIPQRVRSHVIASEYRDLSAWIGGSIFASLSTFPKLAVCQEQYNEIGKEAINMKLDNLCFL